jgi:hypothetical protein
MKGIWIACVFVVSLCALRAAAGEWTGYIADSKWKHTDGSAKSIECTKNRIKAGAEVVFVNTADDKVYKIANPEEVKEHYGHKVVVPGTWKRTR